MRKLIAVAICLIAVPLFAQNPTDFLSAIDTAVRNNGGPCRSGLYRYTGGNTLPGGWLLQTPNVWGKRPSEVVPYDHSTFFADAIGDVIAQAKTVVDITTLAPEPDGFFQGVIVTGLKKVAASGNPVTVRILIGSWITGPTVDPKKYVADLASAIGNVPNNHLKIYVASQRSSGTSWNHSKIVEVDGKIAITGGHNLWPVDYLGPQPVHDLSMRVDGPAAYAAFDFANTMWDYVRWCVGTGAWCAGFPSYVWYDGRIYQEAPPAIAVDVPAGTGDVPVIGAGRAGEAMLDCSGKDAHPSDTGMLAIFDHAQTSIKLSQQDLLLSKCGYSFRKEWGAGFKALGRAVGRGVQLYVVLTNYRAKGGNGGEPYSTCVETSEVWRSLYDAVERETGWHGATVRLRMKERVHIATLRFGPGEAWDNGFPFANHAKMMIVDDSVFYIGSSNFYSSPLQEFGYFVQRPAAVQTLLTGYWDKLWEYSKRTEYIPK